MSSKQTKTATAANSARAEHITTANDRPSGDRGTAMGPRIFELLQARRLSFSLTLLAVCFLFAAARPAHAQAQALGRNAVSAQLHIQVYLVPVTMAQIQAAQLKPQLASDPVSYEMKTTTNPRTETISTVAPLPAETMPAGPASSGSAVLETTTVVPR